MQAACVQHVMALEGDLAQAMSMLAEQHCVYDGTDCLSNRGASKCVAHLCG